MHSITIEVYKAQDITTHSWKRQMVIQPGTRPQKMSDLVLLRCDSDMQSRAP